jgi:hypothetical protein
MYSKLTLMAAASVALAFAKLTPNEVFANRISVDPVGEQVLVEAPLWDPDPDDAVAAAPVRGSGPLGVAAPGTGSKLDQALSQLGRYIARQSHPEALRYAFRAYYNYRAAHPEDVRKPYLYFVDFGLDSRTPRGYVFDMDALALIAGPFNVAHGRGSELGDSLLPTRFLNAQGSNATSLGLYVAQETYGFSGRAGGGSYRSIGLRLRGVSGRFNNAARERGIVVHGAPYVTPSLAGRSEGCPAMEPHLAERLIPRLANGGLVFHFSPLDTRWLREDPWAGSITPSLAGIW